MNERERVLRHQRNLERVAAFFLGFAIMMLAGLLFSGGGCGGDIPTLPTLTFSDDGGVDGGRP